MASSAEDVSVGELTGTFITLEGPEGAGKTTQIKLLAKQLEANKIPYVITRDPGGTPLGRHIRRLLLSPDSPVVPMAELLLYQADRAQHVSEVIFPALRKGHLVICDRFIDSTLAYQGYGRGIDLNLIRSLNLVSTLGLSPKLTILFDIKSEEGLARRHPGGRDRLELEAIDFHHRVRDGYLQLAASEPDRWYVLNADKALTQVQEELRKVFSERLQYSL